MISKNPIGNCFYSSFEGLPPYAIISSYLKKKSEFLRLPPNWKRLSLLVLLATATTTNSFEKEKDKGRRARQQCRQFLITMPFHTRQLFLFFLILRNAYWMRCAQVALLFFWEKILFWQCSRDTLNLLGKSERTGSHTHRLALCVGRSSPNCTRSRRITCVRHLWASRQKSELVCSRGLFYCTRTVGCFYFFRVAADSAAHFFGWLKRIQFTLPVCVVCCHRLILTIVGIGDLEDDRDKPAATLLATESLLAFTLRGRDDGRR